MALCSSRSMHVLQLLLLLLSTLSLVVAALPRSPPLLPRLLLGSTVPGALPSPAAASGYHYNTNYFTQQLDHFSAADSRTFQQRYLVNTETWKPGNPIFFYTGNEGDITWFCNNTGFVWEIAPTYGAMVVFAEHRYYGESLPFGNQSYKDAAHLAYLSSEQALADFAVLATALKETYKSPSSPVIAFGGSYGGMLSAWFRIKYPAIVQGSIAASAPIWAFTGMISCSYPFDIITRDFREINVNCEDNLDRSWDAIPRVIDSNGTGWIDSTFQLCSPLTPELVDDFQNWIINTWFNLAMVDYPYAANFLEPLPAWPINKTCESLSQKLTDDQQLLQAVSQALRVYYNSTGTVSCLNISSDATSSLSNQGWNFQACTEMVMPMCQTEETMFPPRPWDYNATRDWCKKLYGVTPRPFWVETLYGGKNISASSNIVFSNGGLDPWSGAGVLESISDTLVAIVIKDGAHHIDIRASNPADPPDVIAARELEKQHIAQWIKDYSN